MKYKAVPDKGKLWVPSVTPTNAWKSIPATVFAQPAGRNSIPTWDSDHAPRQRLHEDWRGDWMIVTDERGRNRRWIEPVLAASLAVPRWEPPLVRSPAFLLLLDLYQLEPRLPRLSQVLQPAPAPGGALTSPCSSQRPRVRPAQAPEAWLEVWRRLGESARSAGPSSESLAHPGAVQLLPSALNRTCNPSCRRLAYPRRPVE